MYVAPSCALILNCVQKPQTFQLSFTVRLKASGVISWSHRLTSKSHGEPRCLKLLTQFIPKSNLCYFLDLLGSHMGFGAIILCILGTRKSSTENIFRLLVLKMAKRSSDTKLLTISKKATKVDNDKQN